MHRGLPVSLVCADDRELHWGMTRLDKSLVLNRGRRSAGSWKEDVLNGGNTSFGLTLSLISRGGGNDFRLTRVGLVHQEVIAEASGQADHVLQELLNGLTIMRGNLAFPWFLGILEEVPARQTASITPTLQHMGVGDGEPVIAAGDSDQLVPVGSIPVSP